MQAYKRLIQTEQNSAQYDQKNGDILNQINRTMWINYLSRFLMNVETYMKPLKG